jgi:hypothetical protein
VTVGAYGNPFDVAVALTGGASQIVRNGPTIYKGIIVRDTGAGCLIRVWDNASAASGTIIDIVNLGAAGVSPTPNNINLWCQNGVFIERVSGTTYEGSVRLG